MAQKVDRLPLLMPLSASETWCDALAVAHRDFDASSQRLFAFTFDVEEEGGYAGTYVHESQRRVDLYWKGPLPESLVALLEELKPDCPVQVFPAAHDVAELRHARSRIMSAPGFRGSGIVMLGLEHDGSALVLVHETEEPPREFVDRLNLDVPVKWERGSAPVAL